MSSVLQSLGMVSAFSLEAADFSGMTETKPGPFIFEVIHKAFIETNEEGSEAAAATAVSMPPTASLRRSREPKIPVFRADHPFLFMIRHRKSGTILFMGRIINPNQG
jgi:serpin B